MWGFKNRVLFYEIDPGGYLRNAICHSILTLLVNGGGVLLTLGGKII